jgi:hypothetical protein
MALTCVVCWGLQSYPPNGAVYLPNAEKDFATLHEVIIDKPYESRRPRPRRCVALTVW